MYVNIYDGYTDLVSGEPFEMPFDDATASPEPFALRFKVKPDITTLDISFLSLSNVTAVDWGLNQNVDMAPRTKRPCGSEVTIFIRPDTDSFKYGIYIYDDEFSFFLSQIETLHTPFPKWFGYAGDYFLKIQSENFTAPLGIFENIDVQPYFRSAYDSEEGSTFKIAPRIWTDLSEVGTFPPNSLYSTWKFYDPFKNCNNIEKIEPQGKFGDDLEILNACDLTFYDEDGMADPSAYPSGGSPRLINRYTAPVDDYSFDKGYSWPQFDTSRLERAMRPFEIKTMHVGKHTAASSAVMPVGINVNDAPKLKYLSINLPKISIQSGNYTGDFYYGSKALGIKLSDSIEQVYGVFTIDNQYVVEDIDPENNGPIFPNYPDEFKGSLPLTPNFAKTKLAYGYGLALEKLFEPHEELIMPNPPSEMIVVDDYATFKTPQAYSSLLRQVDDGYEYYSPPALGNKVEVIGGYCESLYQNQTLGDGSFVQLSGSTDLVQVNGSVTIPVLPSTVRIVRSFLKRTFSGAHGNALQQSISAGAVPKTHLFYGEPAADEEYATGFNAIANYEPQQGGELEEEWGYKYHHNNDPAAGAVMLDAYLKEQMGDWPETYTVDILTGGISIETGPLPNLQYAIDWQEECWFNAVIDPRSFDTLLVPLPSTVRSENAYVKALAIATPNPRGKLLIWATDTNGRTPSGDLAEHADGRRRSLTFVSYVNPFTPEDLKKYDWYLTDIKLPDFILYNRTGYTYNAFSDLFKNIYGDPNAFFTRFRVDDSKKTLTARKTYLNMLDPADFNFDAMPSTQICFTYRVHQMAVQGDYLYGKWLSTPRVEKAIPVDFQRPEDQLAFYEYKFEWARINNSPRTVPVPFDISDDYRAKDFREATLKW